jgi:hypothetical protein
MWSSDGIILTVENRRVCGEKNVYPIAPTNTTRTGLVSHARLRAERPGNNREPW